MPQAPHRLDQERPSGPAVWKPPGSRKLGAREIIPPLLLLVFPVVAWFAFAYFLN